MLSIAPTAENTAPLANGQVAQTVSYAPALSTLSETKRTTSVVPLLGDPTKVVVAMQDATTLEGYGTHFARILNVSNGTYTGDSQVCAQYTYNTRTGLRCVSYKTVQVSYDQIPWKNGVVGKVYNCTKYNSKYVISFTQSGMVVAKPGTICTERSTTDYTYQIVGGGAGTADTSYITTSGSVVRAKNSDIIAITDPKCSHLSTSAGFFGGSDHYYTWCETYGLSADGRIGTAHFFQDFSSPGGLTGAIADVLSTPIGKIVSLVGLVVTGGQLLGVVGSGGFTIGNAVGLVLGAASHALFSGFTISSVAAVAHPTAYGTVESSNGLGVGTWTWSGLPTASPNACTNGAINSPACNQCANNYAFSTTTTSCIFCSNGGCVGPGGSKTNPKGGLVCNNTAGNPPACDTFSPFAMLTASPGTIDVGGSSKLSWSSLRATSCTGSFPTGGATEGSFSTGPLDKTTSYQITCKDNAGAFGTALATVAVRVPGASITADPLRVTHGQTTTISWDAQYVKSCTVSGPGLSSTNLSGSQQVAISSPSTFTITCATNAAPLKQSVLVNVAPVFNQF